MPGTQERDSLGNLSIFSCYFYYRQDHLWHEKFNNKDLVYQAYQALPIKCDWLRCLWGTNGMREWVVGEGNVNTNCGIVTSHRNSISCLASVWTSVCIN